MKIYRFTVMLLLLCLPLQVFSAVAINCLHASSGQEDKTRTMAANCHAESISIQAADDGSTLDCQKCALEMLLVSTTPTILLSGDISLVSSIKYAAKSHYYYHLSIPLKGRPPADA